MTQHINRVSNSKLHPEDTEIPLLNTAFQFDNFNIKEEDITAEANDLLSKSNDVINKHSNPFPVDVFPLSIQQIIKDTHTYLNFPIDFIGASILYAASVAIGNTHKVEVKRGWLESAVIYMAIVARSGVNKSHPLSFALQPITDLDKITYREYEQLRQEYEKVNNISKKERDQQLITEPSKPVWNKSLLSDFTPEALAQVHKHNKRGIGVYADELAGWFKNFNRYNSGSEMEFWLSAWSGKPINIDRKSGEPVFIPMPFISVCGTIQNAILNELAKESRTQNGFIDRILFVIPDNIKKPYWNEAEINPEIISKWQSIVSNLLSLEITNDETLNPLPEILKFSPEAKKILYDWQKKNTDLSNDVANDATSGIFAKLEMYAVRLALIIEMLRFACGEGNKSVISKEAILSALSLIEYFKKAALKVNRILANESPLDKFPTDKQKLYNNLPETFTTEVGFEIADNLRIAERTYKRFLNEKELFIRVTRGEYEKKFY